MKRVTSADSIVLAELAAVLRAIAAERRQSRRVLRGMASAYEAQAAALMPDARAPQSHY